MIVLDDLGFADLGCYGSAISTPAMDSTAASGLRYNSFHATAICTASRAALLTGRNHHAVGMGLLTAPMRHSGYNAKIPKTASTLPRLLRDQGYNTFAVGKWHLTPLSEESPAGPFDRWPLGLGFERYYGFTITQNGHYAPQLVIDNCFVELPRSPFAGYHVTEDLADQAISMVQDQQYAAPRKPFFLYFATSAPHYPHQVPSDWIKAYQNRFYEGWDSIRQDVFAKQQRMGVVPPNATLTKRPAWIPGWSDLSRDERMLFSRQMEIYAEFVTHTDAQIGRLLTSLEQLGIMENSYYSRG